MERGCMTCARRVGGSRVTPMQSSEPSLLPLGLIRHPSLLSPPTSPDVDTAPPPQRPQPSHPTSTSHPMQIHPHARTEQPHRRRAASPHTNPIHPALLHLAGLTSFTDGTGHGGCRGRWRAQGGGAECGVAVWWCWFTWRADASSCASSSAVACASCATCLS